MTRILHVSKYYYPYVGGVEDVCYNIVRFLQSKGNYEQRVFCFNDQSNTVEDTYDGIPVTRVGVSKVISSQPISFGYEKELKRIIGDFQPDAVHFHAPNPLGAYQLLKVLPDSAKLVVHWHSDIVAQQILYNLIRPVESRLLQRADIIIATSPEYLDYSKPLQPFTNKVEVLQNVIDPFKFEMNKMRQQQVEEIKTRYDGKPIVLFVGRHVLYKGLQYLVEAAREITSECAIIIGGKGPLTNDLQMAAKRLKNMHFVGRIDENELAAYFHATDVFAFPSITRNEAFGVALAEAMYCRTPAVTFTIKGSGVNWVNLNGKTGLEVENPNVKAFAGAVNSLLTDSSLWSNMATQAKQRIEDLFLIDKISNKIEQIYR